MVVRGSNWCDSILNDFSVLSILKKVLFIAALVLFLVLDSQAQCAMCRAVLESEESQTAAEGINNGIIYLMAIPYILIAGIGYIIYRKFFKAKEVQKA